MHGYSCNEIVKNIPGPKYSTVHFLCDWKKCIFNGKLKSSTGVFVTRVQFELGEKVFYRHMSSCDDSYRLQCIPL